MIRANIDTFRQIGDRRIHFKVKVTLILCVFSGSNVRSKWRLLFIITSNNKTPQSLIWDMLSSPAPEADSYQFTQGGSKVRRLFQSTIVGGGGCTELRHSDRNLRTAWFEKGYYKKGFKKNDIYSALCCETKCMNLTIAILDFGVRLYGCSELSKHLSKCLPRMRKTLKYIFLWWRKISEAVCKKHDWHNVTSYLFFNMQKLLN